MSLPIGIPAIDDSKPIIEIAPPTEGAYYLDTDTVLLDFACLDARSGVETCEATIDTVLPAAVGDDLTLLAPGPHTLEVTGTDRAGNEETRVINWELTSVPVPEVVDTVPNPRQR